MRPLCTPRWARASSRDTLHDRNHEMHEDPNPREIASPRLCGLQLQSMLSCARPILALLEVL